MRDTIFAPATPPGRGAVAVVRISGPQSADVLQGLTGRPLPEVRRASVRRLRGPGGELLDEAVVIWWPGPASYTGEDSVELHLHGSTAVLSAVASALTTYGLRFAAPGEFTRRAFANGRADLTQAEAVADLIDAETEQQRRQALAQLGGALSARYEAWRYELLDILALLEATIDFPDEEIPPQTKEDVLLRSRKLLDVLVQAGQDRGGERVREGVRIALIGAPNVGKSSLLNALVKREAAIVTAVPGTTRDVVEASMSLGGQLALLADTAGLREASDLVEAEGIRRASAWAASADVRIGVVDRSRPATFAAVAGTLGAGDVLAVNKSDVESAAIKFETAANQLDTSARLGQISGLLDWLTTRVQALTGRSELPAVTQARHRSLIEEAAGHLRRGIGAFDHGTELASEDLRLALRSLERVVGLTDPEAVLDRVFSRFCIGK